MFSQYRLIKQVASKATGRTYLAQSLSGKKVVLKTFGFAQQQKEHGRFPQQAQALIRLKHAHILPTLDAGTENGLPYIATLYASRGSLYTRLKQSVSGPIPGVEALEILSTVGQALSYAHEHNIVHGNIKPENIVFNSAGEAFLGDFSPTAMFDTPKRPSSPNTRSMCYMAPEQFDGVVSKESDQYALGCLAYELFTGRVPFSALALSTMRQMHASVFPIAPTELVLALPEYIELAILKAMAKNPADRHGDVLTFIKALNTVVKPGDLKDSPIFPPLPSVLSDNTPPAPSSSTSAQLKLQDIQTYEPEGITILKALQNSGAVPPVGTMSKGLVARSQPFRQPRTLWLIIAAACMVFLVVGYVLLSFLFATTRMPDNKRVDLSTVLPGKSTTIPPLTLSPIPTSPLVPLTIPTRIPTMVPTSTPQASLTGLFTGNISSVNLTKEGTIDWAHWGLYSDDDFDHKAGVAPQISNYTAIGDGIVGRNTANPTSFTWSNGMPNQTASDSATGIFIPGSDDGFSFTVQASTTMRTLKVYVGVGHVQGKFTATLSGNGAPPAYVDTTLKNTGVATGVYTINYMAATPGQHLTITFVIIDTLASNPNLKLLAATVR